MFWKKEQSKTGHLKIIIIKGEKKKAFVFFHSESGEVFWTITWYGRSKRDSCTVLGVGWREEKRHSGRFITLVSGAQRDGAESDWKAWQRGDNVLWLYMDKAWKMTRTLNLIHLFQDTNTYIRGTISWISRMHTHTHTLSHKHFNSGYMSQIPSYPLLPYLQSKHKCQWRVSISFRTISLEYWSQILNLTNQWRPSRHQVHTFSV